MERAGTGLRQPVFPTRRRCIRSYHPARNFTPRLPRQQNASMLHRELRTERREPLVICSGAREQDQRMVHDSSGNEALPLADALPVPSRVSRTQALPHVFFGILAAELPFHRTAPLLLARAIRPSRPAWQLLDYLHQRHKRKWLVHHRHSVSLACFFQCCRTGGNGDHWQRGMLPPQVRDHVLT